MKVELINPDARDRLGSIIDVSPEEAKGLVDAGMARYDADVVQNRAEDGTRNPEADAVEAAAEGSASDEGNALETASPAVADGAQDQTPGQGSVEDEADPKSGTKRKRERSTRQTRETRKEK